MSRKPKDAPPTAPPSFPQTVPPGLGADVGGWVLNSVNQLNATAARLETRLDGIEDALKRLDGKLDRIDGEVAGHGKWMHTLKAFAGVGVVIGGWLFVNGVWPWLKAKVGL